MLTHGGETARGAQPQFSLSQLNCTVFELVGEVPVGPSPRYMHLPVCNLALLTDTRSTRSVLIPVSLSAGY